MKAILYIVVFFLAFSSYAQKNAEIRLTQLENENLKLRSELDGIKQNQEANKAFYRANE